MKTSKQTKQVEEAFVGVFHSQAPVEVDSDWQRRVMNHVHNHPISLQPVVPPTDDRFVWQLAWGTAVAAVIVAVLFSIMQLSTPSSSSFPSEMFVLDNILNSQVTLAQR